MKSFEYPGGTVSIPIPSEWVEEMEDDDIHLFYDVGCDSECFRARIMTYAGPNEANRADVRKYLTNMAAEVQPGKSAEIIDLADGSQMVSTMQTLLRDDPPHVLLSWIVGSVTGKHRVQIALYTFAMPPEAVNSNDTMLKVVRLKKSVSQAQYEVEPDPEAPKPQRKPWWKRN